jgi:hypothetical protein
VTRTRESRARRARDRKPEAAERYRKRDARRRARTGLPGNPHGPQPNAFGANTLDLLQPDILAKVTELASRSVPHSLIARCLGMTLPAFRKHCEANPDFQAALDAGHAEEEFWAVSRLRQVAEGDGKHAVLATLAILNSRHGYRGDNAKRVTPQVVINLPGTLPAEQYARLVESEALLLPAEASRE